MNFIWFVVFGIVVFLMSLICYEKFRATTLYALAIGGAVNANFFHAGIYPIECFGLPFGIDSIIYSLFLFCVFVMFVKVNKREAYILSFSSIVAIMFSAFMQLVSDLFSEGFTAGAWQTFATFLVSSVASLIAVWLMIECLDYLKKKNINSYLLLIFGMVVATFVNSVIYYPLATLINSVPDNMLQLLLASVIGKLISIILGLFVFYLINKVEVVIEKRGVSLNKEKE